jgi:hypothetical protein
MEKRGLIIIALFLLIVLPTISATVDSEIQKITHYAEEYETGNVNYAQFLTYLSSARENLNEMLGAVDYEGGILKQEQLESLLGKSQEETKWIWIEGENHEKKLDYSVPVWRKIIFDGNKIRIRLNAHPSLHIIKTKEEREKIWKLEEEGRYEEANKLRNEGERQLIYRLHFDIEFKKDEKKLDIKSMIEKVKSIAEKFHENPSNENAEDLAEESVNVEKSFDSYYRQSFGKCEDTMSSIFGSENLREIAEIVTYEIEFHEGEDFEAIFRLEMCEECEWNWINIHMWIDARGRFPMPEMKEKDFDYERAEKKYRSLTQPDFESEAKQILEKIKENLELKNYKEAMILSNELNILNNVWNEKSNNVWEEVEKIMHFDEELMTEEERHEFHQNYGWIRLEQKRREKMKELQEENLERRKEFYLDFFKDYEQQEFYVKQMDFEKRLIEEFRTHGQERCDNNEDDDGNGQIDCGDSQCNGQYCGSVIENIIINNQTKEQKVDLFCIAGICQQKQEFIEEDKPTCGNNICEENEELNCIEDCVKCHVWDAIQCKGKLMFSGEDEKGCPLEPICIEEVKTCEIKEDCSQPLCGEADCIEGSCQVIELEECKERECEEGQEKRKKCGMEELIVEICKEGVWIDTNVYCEENGVEEEIIEEEIIADECVIKTDCGGEFDVCSNGKCITIPIEEELEEENKEIIEEKLKIDEELEEENREIIEEEIKSGIINSILGMLGKITGMTVAEDSSSEEIEQSESEEQKDESVEPESDIDYIDDVIEDEYVEEGYSEDEYIKEYTEEGSFEEKEEYEEEDWEERERREQEERERREDEDRERHEEEERERREKECADRCSRECNDRLIRPCAEECTWEECGDELECDIDKVTKECEEKCEKEKDLEECEEECDDKCMKGDNTWIEPEFKEWTEEVGVFNLGGGCRTEEGDTHAYLWFGGWGEPFEKIQRLKDKYYFGGEADWCEWELESLKKQRKEFEKSFNQEFATWFFEKYLVNSAEDWEQMHSGIFELFWSNVDISRRIAERMSCLGMDKIPFDYKLLNFTYETEYGRVEYWEEIQSHNFDYMNKDSRDKKMKDVEIITPYMKVWIFPSEDFIKYELKESMENHEFPGSPEEKLEREKQEGPNEEEKEMIKNNKRFMKTFRKIIEEYGDNLDVAVEFKDYETEEIIFNLHVQLNEKDIMLIEPMLPSEVPSKDITITLDFDELYKIIHKAEKDMSGERIEAPEWARRPIKPIDKINEIKNGILIATKIRGMINDAEITPKEARKDVRKFTNAVFVMMIREGIKGEEDSYEESKEEEKEFETLSGQVVKDFE